MWQILFCLVWTKLLFNDICVFATDSFKMFHNLNAETVDRTCGSPFSCVYTPATSTNVFVHSEATPSMATLLSPAQFLTTSCTPTMTITTQHITTPTVTCSDTYHCQPLQSPKSHQCHNHLHNHNPTQKIIIQPSPTPLPFDPENIDFFFQRFESMYRHNNLSSSELFDKLLQSLNYNHQCRMQSLLSHGTNDYSQLKEALYHTYGRTIDQSIQDLSQVPELGDKLPSELLAQLRRTLGRHLQANPLLKHTIRREFFSRLPVYTRDMLTMMDNPTLDELAQKADALISNRNQYSIDRAISSHSQQNKTATEHNIHSSGYMTQDHKITDELVKTLQNLNSKLDHVVEQQHHLFRHSNEPYTVPSQYHATASSPYRHPAHSPHIDKFYAQTPATSGHNHPRHPSTITSGPTEFCWYHNTFGPRAIKCSPGCTFSQQTTSQSKPLNYQGGASNLAPRQTLLRYTQ